MKLEMWENWFIEENETQNNNYYEVKDLVNWIIWNSIDYLMNFYWDKWKNIYFSNLKNKSELDIDETKWLNYFVDILIYQLSKKPENKNFDKEKYKNKNDEYKKYINYIYKNYYNYLNKHNLIKINKI